MVVLLIGVGIIFNNLNEDNVVIENQPNNEVATPIILVQIVGEVLRPGIYEMSEGDRINDVINLSGGFTSRADTSSINLVAKVSDGMVIVINPKKSHEEIVNNEDQLISINKANLSELMSLEGIGEAKAKNIISYREQNGGFKSIEEIMNVSGISESIFNKIKDKICL